MGFNFNFTGPRDEVARDLTDLDNIRDLNRDVLGVRLRDLLVAHLKQGGEPGPGLQYRVEAEGHSDSAAGNTVWLRVNVGMESLNADLSQPAGRHRLAEYGLAADGLLTTAEDPPA